jgi:antirestriction protein
MYISKKDFTVNVFTTLSNGEEVSTEIVLNHHTDAESVLEEAKQEFIDIHGDIAEDLELTSLEFDILDGFEDFTSDNLDELVEIANDLDRDDESVIQALLAYMSDTKSDIRYARDHYQGTYEDAEDYARSYFDNTSGNSGDVPSEYIDFESWGEDMLRYESVYDVSGGIAVFTG